MVVPTGAGNSSQRSSFPPAISTAAPVDSSAERVSSSSRETRRDGRQGFAPKSERCDGQQVLYVAEFAGGVSLESEQRVVAQHAAAVVRDPDQMAAAGFDIDFELGCAGVQRIFDQFFDDGSRTLDHFSGCDLVRDRVGEDSDFSHGERRD